LPVTARMDSAALVVEFGGDIHRVLPGQAIDDQQGFARVGHVADRGGLRDQFGVDMQTARGVEHVDIIAAKAGLGLGALGDLDRGLALDDGQRIDADLGAEDLQLFHGGRAVHVERGHQDALAIPLFQALGELGGGGRLARPLQPDHQDRGGRVVDLEFSRVAVAGQDMNQLVMDDFDDLLAGCDGSGHGLSGGLVLHGGDEVARDGQRNIGLQQGDAHFAQGGLHILVGQRALLGQALEHAREAV